MEAAHALVITHRPGQPAVEIGAVQPAGLDAEKIAQCVASGETAGIVERSIQSARDRGIQATPTLLYSLDGGQTVQLFAEANGMPSLEMVEQVISRAAQGG